MYLSVATDISGLKVKLFELRNTVINKAIPSALNKTASIARTQVTKAIRLKLKKMKAARIKKRIIVVRANPANQRAIVRARDSKVPPGAFTLPGHGDKLFIHVGPKHRIIVAQSGKSIGKKISSGYQLAPLSSVQVLREFSKSYAQQIMTTVVRERFPVIFEREMNYYAKR